MQVRIDDRLPWKKGFIHDIGADEERHLSQIDPWIASDILDAMVSESDKAIKRMMNWGKQ
jgi:hypothetical protein